MGILYEMGARSAMSTPRECTICPEFSGKLSLVMLTPDDLPPSTPPADADPAAAKPPAEIGGRDGPEPTRFGDWELRGRCIDF
jgi:hypothetical protein